MAEAAVLTTSDGASLGYVRQGTGDLLLLVHGGGTDHRCFGDVLPALAARYETVAYDRRGRGMSTDVGPYSLAREAADLVELLDHVGDGRPVRIVAYSFGGLVVLDALPSMADRVAAAVLYETPLGVPGLFPGTLVDDVERLVAEGRYNEAARRFVRDTFFLDDRLIDVFERGPLWQTSLDAGPTLPRELRAIEATMLDAAWYAECRVPVRYLVGAEGGNPAFRAIADLVSSAVPNAEAHSIPGIPHFAHNSNPADFVERVVEFFDRN